MEEPEADTRGSQTLTTEIVMEDSKSIPDRNASGSTETSDNSDAQLQLGRTDDKEEVEEEEEVPGDKYKIWKTAYVVVALVFGFGLAGLKSVSSGFSAWLDEAEIDIMNYLQQPQAIYLNILCLVVITMMKSVGIKDVFGLRTIAVCILAANVTNKKQMAAFLVAMLLQGVLSSVSKLMEYRAIGPELQYVIGLPTKYIMGGIKYVLLKLLKLCNKKSDTSLLWFDTKYTLAISYKSRDAKHMSIMKNFKFMDPSIASTATTGVRRDNMYWLKESAYFTVAVLWTSCVEWVQPITELFLFAHNWQLTPLNAIIIIFAEFLDFDKAVETWLVLQAVIENNTSLIDTKIGIIAIKSYFWLLGYTVVLFPTLWWANKFYYKYQSFFEEQQVSGEVATEASSNETITSDTSVTEQKQKQGTMEAEPQQAKQVTNMPSGNTPLPAQQSTQL